MPWRWNNRQSVVKMDSVQGYVQSVVFYNEVNKYAIVRLRLDQKKDERLVLVGYFPIPKKDELCCFYGSYIDHPKFGRQFKVESFEKIMPNGKEAIVRYLSSAAFKGVGSASAAKVVEVLGDDCLNLLRSNPDLINEVNIKDKLKPIIIKGISVTTKLDEAIKLFVGHGINMKYLIKMDAIYGENLIPIVLENPYVLIRDVDGMGFKTVDKIAKSMGVGTDDQRRLEALVSYACKYLCYQSQDTYTSQRNLFSCACREVEDLTYEQFELAYNNLIAEKELVEENGNHIFPKDLYEAECGIASYLHPYLTERLGIVPAKLIEEEIDNVQRLESIVYSEEQRQAIITCINSGISIITGGPGTGKTTVVNAIIKIYNRLFPQDEITLCAPTGRASKRMSELTGKEATTIHRLLKWDLDSGRFGIDENNPITGDFLIVDEFSMVDCQLFYHLLKGTFPYKRVLLIGDDKQLPPVSPGDVLRDLLELKLLPTTELIQIHRQNSDSGIIPLCYNVRRGELDRSNLDKVDVKFYPCPSSDIRSLILRLVEDAVAEGMSQADIQLLAPMYDGAAGINSLNDLLRDYFNPQDGLKKEVAIGRTTYRIGDKILQLKNQPDDNVYNGDIGWLKEIDDEGGTLKLFIEFDGNLVSYTSAEFMNISHAYCISVHKSQGSEYEYVIMPIVSEHYVMLRRKLIYTGISRAKQKLAIVGSLASFEKGIQRVEQNVRKTSLQQRIRECVDK